MSRWFHIDICLLDLNSQQVRNAIPWPTHSLLISIWPLVMAAHAFSIPCIRPRFNDWYLWLWELWLRGGAQFRSTSRSSHPAPILTTLIFQDALVPFSNFGDVDALPEQWLWDVHPHEYPAEPEEIVCCAIRPIDDLLVSTNFNSQLVCTAISYADNSMADLTLTMLNSQDWFSPPSWILHSESYFKPCA